ncbi:hypothetical protein UlMin_022241 [Ulmus minor]
MPQDGLKSVIYRSFVTCEDPKGVVDCRTSRKSKTDSQKMDNKRESKRKLKMKSCSSLNFKPEEEEIKASKGIREEISSPSSFQLMEVSRGAQKLNQMIESWSKGVSSDGKSKDIAKDLLKGALDLQDSLVMLGKLQEASQYMAHLKKKQMEKIDEPCITRTCSDHFREKPRLSVDGSSRSSPGELKKVIRESLVKQNLFPKTSVNGSSSFSPSRNLVSASESPTSSSQSSLAQANSESSVAISAAPQKTKGPSLIAKLMGLEEYPLKPLQGSTPQKQMAGQKISNQQRPVFEIDRPKVKKPQPVVQRADPERRTLKEILETMQFKGLLRSNSANGLEPCYLHSSDFHSKQRLDDHGPPIVLIKPLRVPFLESRETSTPLYEEEETLNRRTMLRKLRTKEELNKRAISHKERTVKFDNVSRKLVAEESPTKGLNKGEARDHRVIVELPEEKEVVVKENALIKLKASPPANHKQQRNEAVEKKAEKFQKATNVNRKPLDKDALKPQRNETFGEKADKIKKVISVNRKPLEKNIVKTKNVSKSQDQAKMAATKAGKPESGSEIVKNPIFRQSRTTTSAEQRVAYSSSNQKRTHIKKEKHVKKPISVKSVIKSGRHEEGEKKIDHTITSEESVFHPETISTNLEDQLPKEENVDTYIVLEDQLPKEENANIYNNVEDQPAKEHDVDTSESQIEEQSIDVQSSLCEVTSPTASTEQESDTKTVEEAPTYIEPCKPDIKTFKSGADLRIALLNSPSFLSHAEELFDLNTNSSSILPTSFVDDFWASGTRLFLDCANELLERKSFQYSQTVHPPLSASVGKSGLCISLKVLVEETCNGIETITNDSKLAVQNLSVDSLYEMLERDLMSKGMVNAIWDCGWRTGFSFDEAEQVVNEVEKLVLTGLIEEVFA